MIVWVVLLALSGIIAAILELIGLPAALLLGPMIAAILIATRGGTVRVPRPAFIGAQAVVGTLIAGAITSGIMATVAEHWPLFLLVTLATLTASSVLGYLLSRWQVLPGTVAVWGSSPGAATAMVVMAQAYGADSRLVAVMMYTRVVCVAGLASILAATLAHGGAGHHVGPDWFTMPPAGVLATTVAVAAIGAAAGMVLRIPAGALIGSMALGAVLNVMGVAHPVLPGWVLAMSYAIVGWRIGLSFNRDTLHVAGKAMPRLLASVALLMAFCAGIALALTRWAGIDPVTAYLATSPGGMDSVAIIASSSPVDVPFVMALQMLRFVGVLLVGPPLARFVANRKGAIIPS